jgi:hypothetical protein
VSNKTVSALSPVTIHMSLRTSVAMATTGSQHGIVVVEVAKVVVAKNASIVSSPGRP